MTHINFHPWYVDDDEDPDEFVKVHIHQQATDVYGIQAGDEVWCVDKVHHTYRLVDVLWIDGLYAAVKTYDVTTYVRLDDPHAAQVLTADRHEAERLADAS